MPVSWFATLTAPNHASEWVNGFTGAVGAILGSIATLIWTEWFNYRSRARDCKSKFATTAFISFQRLNHIYSVAKISRTHLEEGADKSRRMQMPLWATTMPLLRISGPITLPLDELWILTQIGGKDLANAVFGLDHSLNQLTDALERYSTERDQLWATMPPPSSMSGSLGTINLSSAQMQQAAPAFARLNGLLEQANTTSIEITKRAFDALTLLIEAKSQPLGKVFAVTLPNPDGHSVELSSRKPSFIRRLMRRIMRVLSSPTGT